jgi:hypothetical protein
MAKIKDEKKFCKMLGFLHKEFNQIAKKKKGQISIIDVWDSELKLEKKFNVRSKTSQKLSFKILDHNRTGNLIIND